MASQASSAEIERTTVDIDVAGKDGKTYGVSATGSVIRFDGFLKIYEEGIDDAVGEDGALPAARQGDALDPRSIEAKQHFTEPPPRYTEATLIKKMEELGIGRPSTYASTLNVLRDRDYVRHRQEAALSRGQGPAGHRLPRELLQAATSNTTSPPISRKSSTSSRPASSNGRTCCAISGASSSPR